MTTEPRYGYDDPIEDRDEFLEGDSIDPEVFHQYARDLKVLAGEAEQ